MSTVALICARGGSKGIPNKNIRRLGGRSLVGWAVMHARGVPRVDRVIVSTDSEDIASEARAEGADVPFLRPSELAGDTSAEWLVWRHALSYLLATDGRYPDALLVVPPTAPLRVSADLERCLDAFGRGDADAVITVTDAHRSPYFNMVTQRPNGEAVLVIPPSAAVTRRQDAPAVFDMTTVAYVARPDFVMREPGLFAGRVRSVHVPIERALDIDTPFDLRIAECLIGRADAKPSGATPPHE